MGLSGEEIRARLSVFASRWSVYEGSERGGAQTFLDELFGCYGTRRSDVADFERPQAGRFLDLIWPRVCLIEMKAPAEAKRLAKHREQALRYWVESADSSANTPAPRYVVLCAFRRLEIWEPGLFPKEPRLVLDLIDLPDQYDALLFLTGPGNDAVFAGGQAALTREAVVHLTFTSSSRIARQRTRTSFATSCSSASGVCSRRTSGSSRATASPMSSTS